MAATDGSGVVSNSPWFSGSGMYVSDEYLGEIYEYDVDKGLQILAEQAMVPFDAALNACTINPARCLGADRRKGRLRAGYDADIVVLEDSYDVCQTYCKGRAML